MFQCDQFIYIHMQKTAGNHIVELMAQLFVGKRIGTHNHASAEQLKSTPYFIGSIRNPWDWYLSLWTFGVGGRGGLRDYLTKRNFRSALRGVLKNPAAGYAECIDALTRDVKTWRSVYSRSDDVAAFRRWLALLHSHKNYGRLGEGDYSVDQHIGLMTHRYLCLYCRYNEQPKPIDFSRFERLRQFDKQACYIDFFIRQEALAESLCVVLEKIRTLTATEKQLIVNARKVNTSIRTLPLSDYYDQASIDLIRERDRLMIEKFDYSPPTQ